LKDLDLNRILIIISAFFILLYSNVEENSKKIFGYANDGSPLYCQEIVNEDEINATLLCDRGVVSRSNYKTKIIFNTTIRLNEGWNIIGMSYDIANVKEFLSNKCILSAKKFENGFWKEYNVLNDINDIKTLKASDALYIYSTKECTIEDTGERVFKQSEINIKSFYIKENNITDINNSNHIDLIDDIQTEDNTTQDEESSQETIEDIEEEQTQDEESSQEITEDIEEEQTQDEESSQETTEDIEEEQTQENN
jgi:hypothetical protein